jgi:SAM-dependent methyltransferase
MAERVCALARWSRARPTDIESVVAGPLTRALLDYHHRAVRLPRAGRVAAALARQIGRAGSLLDVGCDDSRVARRVAELVGAERVVGVDIEVTATGEPAADQGDDASRQGIELMRYDGTTLPFAEQSFDAVTVADVLHHCQDPARLLGEALRVSRGPVAIKDHFRFGPASDRLLWLMDRVGNARHGIEVRGTYFFPAQFVQLVERAGGRLRALEWPLNIHDYPFRLITQDRLQFAARVERAHSPGHRARDATEPA